MAVASPRTPSPALGSSELASPTHYSKISSDAVDYCLLAKSCCVVCVVLVLTQLVSKLFNSVPRQKSERK